MIGVLLGFLHTFHSRRIQFDQAAYNDAIYRARLASVSRHHSDAAFAARRNDPDIIDVEWEEVEEPIALSAPKDAQD